MAATAAIPDPLGRADTLPVMTADSGLLLPGRRYRSGLGRVVDVATCGGGRLEVDIMERGRGAGRVYRAASSREPEGATPWCRDDGSEEDEEDDDMESGAG